MTTLIEGMNKTERCVQLTSWLERGECFTISEAAARLDVPYRYVWRDVDSLTRVLPVARDEEGRLHLIRLIPT